jgi:hypothetical protein
VDLDEDWEPSRPTVRRREGRPSDQETNWFYVPKGSSNVSLSTEHFLEYTGNEAQLGDAKYGKFVRRKVSARMGRKMLGQQNNYLNGAQAIVGL